MKPISASDILRKSVPRDFLGASFAHKNRFDAFRDPSPANSTRTRLGSTASTKRKGEDISDDFHDLAPPIKKNSSPWICETPVENHTTVSLSEEDEVEFACLESNISKVSDKCNKMTEELQRLHIEEPLRIILGDLIEAVQTTNKVQAGLSARIRKNATTTVSNNCSSSYVSAVSSQPPVNPPIRQTSSQTSRKKLSGGLYASQTDDRGNFNSKVSVPAPTAKKVESPEEVKVRKFNEAIRDAERSTLCFNLNMGNKPIMNKTTIAERATLALTTMAAKAEGKHSSVPSQEAVSVIDDVVSMVTKMEFYGANTKQYKGNDKDKDKDKDTPAFCTVPVKYQFKDREQRIFAEKQLRDTCKVKCATPYPVVVRECIKQVIDHVRLSHPDDFVKVNVHANKFALKVSRRPKGKDLPWIEYPDLLSLPNEALDISLKKVPDGLKMFFLPNFDNDDCMNTSSQETERPKSPRTP
jgi:hypothetical protein